jgi:hypothetical protein
MSFLAIEEKCPIFEKFHCIQIYGLSVDLLLISHPYLSKKKMREMKKKMGKNSSH